MTTTSLMPLPKLHFETALGTPLVGGKLYTYAAGGNNPKATFTDAAGTIPHENPITLNLRGEPPAAVYWSGSYRVELRDALGNVIYSVDNYTDPASIVDSIISGFQLADYVALRAYAGSQKMVYVTGYLATAAPAGIAGSFVRDDSDNATADDSGTVIVDALGRRWKRTIDGAMYFEWFGAKFDGVTDDHNALQAALTAAGKLSSATVRVRTSSGVAKSNSGITWDVNRVSVDFNGATIDFSGMVAGNALSFTQSSNDPNIRPLLNHAHPISNGVFKGPGVAVTAVAGINIFDNAAPNTISGMNFFNCSLLNFASDIVFGNGAFCTTFYKCNFNCTAGLATTYSVTFPGAAANSGERNEFIACKWTNRNLVLDQSNPNATTFFTNCSMDYFSTRSMVISGGQVFIAQSHIESNTDTDYWFQVSNNSTGLHLNGVNINLLGDRNNFALFYSDATATHGGVSLQDVTVQSSKQFAARLIGGTGRVAVKNLTFLANSARPVIAEYLNALAYGDFESANALAEWVLGGTTPPSRSVAIYHTGTASLMFAASPANSPSASKTIPASAGQYFSGELWYTTQGFGGSNATFYIQTDWLDAGGNSLSSDASLAVTVDTAWTRQGVRMASPAPKGTKSLRVSINIFGIAAGAPTAYIDGVIFNVV